MTTSVSRTRLAGALVALSVLAMTACGGSSGSGSQSQSDGPVVWWVPGPDTVDGTSQAIAAEFTKETGIKVDMVMSPWDGYTTKLTSAIASGQGPDIVELGNTDVPTFANSGAFLSWDSANLSAIGGGDQFVQRALTAYSSPDKPPSSIPFSAGAWCLLYNKQQFKAAGITTPPRTWDDFQVDAKKLSDPSKGQYGVAIAGGTPAAMSVWSWILGEQYGSPYYTAGGKPTVATPALTDAITNLVKWVYPDQIMSPTAVADNANGDNALFNSNKAAMDITQNPQAAIDHPDQYGLSLIPLPDPLPSGGKAVMSHIAGVNLAVLKNAKHKDNALKLAKFLSGPKAQVMEAKGESGIPVTKAALADPAFQSAAMKAFGDVFAKYSMATPSEATASNLINGVGDAVVKLFQNDAATKGVTSDQVLEALKKVEQTVQAGG